MTGPCRKDILSNVLYPRNPTQRAVKRSRHMDRQAAVLTEVRETFISIACLHILHPGVVRRHTVFPYRRRALTRQRKRSFVNAQQSYTLSLNCTEFVPQD